MKIALAQINTTIGDFRGNAARIEERLRWAEGEGVDLVLFPELTVCGYPPRDLLEKPSFVQRNLEAVEAIAAKTRHTAVVVGFVSLNESAEGQGLFNSAAILRDGRVQFVQHKTLLPEYDVFDEARYFEPAKEHGVYDFDGVTIGLTMCEDIWSRHEFAGRRLYRIDPVSLVVEAGADIVLNLSASPFTIGKQAIRRELITGEAKNLSRPILYCNQVGGNDELVFDGRSIVVDAKGQIVREGAAFAEESFIVDTDQLNPAANLLDLPEEEEIRQALVLGLRDYMRKCGFDRVVIGLSGGIDSAVVAAIATEAIGPDKVLGVLMPSPYSSESSVTDAQALAKNLGIITCTEPIGDIYETYRQQLAFDPNTVTLAEENIQARIRGNILMAISNREGALVLSTGNKSEISVGYCTLYGDMAGGLALISDIPKTMVFALARHLNRKHEVIPQAILTKPPSAELRPDQQDTDSLPPYEILDPIIRAYVEERQSVAAIIAMGFEAALVERITGMIDRNEYKRRQSAPGLKITSKAFGPGRRCPIAHYY